MMPQVLNEETIKEIAGDLEIGMRCFYNKLSGAIESYPRNIEFSDIEELWEDVIGKINANLNNYFEFKAMTSGEVFRAMENFVRTIDHESTHNKFAKVLLRKKPFANFNDMLLSYPKLREEWFAFKNKTFIDFLRKQAGLFLEYATTIKQSFHQDFCAVLEYHLTRTLANSPGQQFRGIWCDGISMPFDEKQLVREHIMATKTIETESFIGTNGQDKYRMIIKLGPMAIRRCLKGSNLDDCLPDEKSLNWISLDFKNKAIVIRLR